MNETLVDKLERLWKDEEMTEFAFEITLLYNSWDCRLISGTLRELKKRIENKERRSPDGI